MTNPILPRREAFAAAVLAERYQNPDVAAYNRKYRAKSKRAEHFWFRVGRDLGAAYGYNGCPTKYEQAVKAQINAVREKLRGAA